MEVIQDRNQADMIWDLIMFQYTAIIRAQKIMFITNEHDMTKESKKNRMVKVEVLRNGKSNSLGISKSLL